MDSVCVTVGRLVFVALLIGAGDGRCGLLQAAQPVVGFDADYAVECRNITPRGAAGHKKIIEATFKLSARLAQGKADDLDTVVYEITHGSPDKGATVVDFIPQKTLYSDIAEPIVVVETSNRSIEGSVDWAAAYAVVARGNIQGAASSESRVEYRKLPPQKALVTSGRIDRGSGVFFKMNGSSYTTLEGQEEVSVMFSVSRNWRAGAVTVKCKADGRQRGILWDKTLSCGRAEFGVGLYLQEDALAEQAAKAFADAQQAFLDEIAATQNDNASGGGIWDVLRPKATEILAQQLTPPQKATLANAALMETLLTNPAQEASLPAGVLNKLDNIREARERLEALSQ